MKYVVIILILALCISLGECGKKNKIGRSSRNSIGTSRSSRSRSSTRSSKGSTSTTSSNDNIRSSNRKNNGKIKKCMEECGNKCTECLFKSDLSSPMCMSCEDGFQVNANGSCVETNIFQCKVDTLGVVTGFNNSTAILPDSEAGSGPVIENTGSGSGTDPCKFSVNIAYDSFLGKLFEFEVVLGETNQQFYFVLMDEIGKAYIDTVSASNEITPTFTWDDTKTFIEITQDDANVWTLKETGGCDYTFHMVLDGPDSETEFTAEIATSLTLDGLCGPLPSP